VVPVPEGEKGGGGGKKTKGGGSLDPCGKKKRKGGVFYEVKSGTWVPGRKKKKKKGRKEASLAAYLPTRIKGGGQISGKKKNALLQREKKRLKKVFAKGEKRNLTLREGEKTSANHP